MFLNRYYHIIISIPIIFGKNSIAYTCSKSKPIDVLNIPCNCKQGWYNFVVNDNEDTLTPGYWSYDNTLQSYTVKIGKTFTRPLNFIEESQRSLAITFATPQAFNLLEELPEYAVEVVTDIEISFEATGKASESFIVVRKDNNLLSPTKLCIDSRLETLSQTKVVFDGDTGFDCLSTASYEQASGTNGCGYCNLPTRDTKLDNVLLEKISLVPLPLSSQVSSSRRFQWRPRNRRPGRTWASRSKTRTHAETKTLYTIKGSYYYIQIQIPKCISRKKPAPRMKTTLDYNYNNPRQNVRPTYYTQTTLSTLSYVQKFEGECGRPHIFERESRDVLKQTQFNNNYVATARQSKPYIYQNPYQNYRNDRIKRYISYKSQKAKIGSWPWHVSIHYNGVHICSGFLVSNKHVVSAAHCFPHLNLNSITVILGSNSNVRGTSINLSRNVSKLYKHLYFNKITKYDSDIALLHLKSPVQFNEYVQPLCLTKIKFDPNMFCQVTGYGINKGSDVDSLHELRVTLMRNGECTKPEVLGERVSENMICAKANSLDACQGDDGSPLQCKINGVWYAAGIVSWKPKECGQSSLKPGVYTRIHDFGKWIIEKATP